MERIIKKILLILDVFSYFSAAYQIVIKRDYELGAILTIISLLLNLFLYFAAHEIKIREILIQTFNINDLEATEKKYFTNFSIGYILVNIVLFIIALLLDYSNILFINIFGLPIVFALFMLCLKIIYEDSTYKFLPVFNLICPTPHIILLLLVLLTGGGDFLSAAIAIFLMYLPTLALCKLVKKICTPKLQGRTV